MFNLSKDPTTVEILNTCHENQTINSNDGSYITNIANSIGSYYQSYNWIASGGATTVSTASSGTFFPYTISSGSNQSNTYTLEDLARAYGIPYIKPIPEKIEVICPDCMLKKVRTPNV